MPLRHDWVIVLGILAQILTFVGLTKGLSAELFPATAPGIRVSCGRDKHASRDEASEASLRRCGGWNSLLS